MRARNSGIITLEDDGQRSRRLRTRYSERASKLRSRAMAMMSAETRQVMLGIADYLQRMADRLERANGAGRALDSKPTKPE